MPRLYGVQSTGSAALFNAYTAETEEIEAVRADTLADSISVDMPRDGLRALRAATKTEGAYLAVEDADILAAMSEMSRLAAVFAEPAGATAYAGLVQALDIGLVHAEDRVLVLNTGSGLKDIQAAMQASGEATVIEPSLEALRKALD
jgi:threonine synthase